MESPEFSQPSQEMVAYQKKILETLKKNARRKREWWDRFSGVSTLLSGIIIAAIGGYFAYSYNNRQADLLDAQNRRSNDTKAHETRILEMETVKKFIPTSREPMKPRRMGRLPRWRRWGIPNWPHA
jgi:hypothetical protein